jgi:hypothetical protein
MGEDGYGARSRTDPTPEWTGLGAFDPARRFPDILLWKPSLADLLLAGVVAGAVLGAANGVVSHLILIGFQSVWVSCLLGTGLGIIGGIGVVFWRRIVWGPDVSVEVGTTIGLLYGIAPGVALLFLSLFVHRVVVAGWGFVSLLMAGSMMGLVIGGVLDRLTEAIIARKKRRQAEQRAAADGP